MPDFRVPPLNAGERVYRALLHLYPPSFRREFSQALVETFRDQRHAARCAGVSGGVFWLATLRDVVTHAPAERVARVWRFLRPDPTMSHQDSPMAALPQAFHGAELRVALRRLRRSPTFAITTVVVLGLGIGATTAVFSIVNGVLLRPLPYASPGQLVAISHTLDVGGITEAQQSEAGLLYYQEHATAFESVGGWRDRDVNVARAGDGGPPERTATALVSANLFRVLGVRPQLGRDFHDGEDRRGAAPVAILGHAMWERLFRGDTTAIGQRIIVDGIPRVVVGVMPASFKFIKTAPALWLPASFDVKTASATSFNYTNIARKRVGVTDRDARVDLERILPHILEEFPSDVPPAMWARAHLQPQVRSLRDYVVGDAPLLLWILLGSVGVVLLIASANVASLFLVRGESRQIELAVRGALGSGPAGMMAQLLSEALLLVAAGGLVGVTLAAAGVKSAAAIGATVGLPRLDQVVVDGRVLLFALAVTIACGLLVSLIPIVRARRIPIAIVLRDAGRHTASGAVRQRARSALVIAQIALALVLVAASGLLMRSFMRLRHVQPGFDGESVISARLVLPEANYATTAAAVQLENQLLVRVRALPGVRAASLTDLLPLASDVNTEVVTVEDHPLPPNALPRVHTEATVDAEYFRALRIPVLAGRSFNPADPSHPAAEAIVSRAFAERYWPGQSPLGRRIRPGIDGGWLTIVGEVGDVHYESLDTPANDAFYLPLVTPPTTNNGVPRFVSLVVDAGSRQSSVAPEIRSIVRSLDPSLPTYDERSLNELIAASSARARVTLSLLAIASALALILGAVGVYGVMAYGVTLRQREIGVRIALGAQPGEVSRMISRQGIVLGMAGVAIGLGLALIVTRFLRGLLYDVSPTDPTTLIVTCGVLIAVALMASWIPARRAAAIDPAEALRAG
jgi:putative ABC transport system permease protein